MGLAGQLSARPILSATDLPMRDESEQASLLRVFKIVQKQSPHRRAEAAAVDDLHANPRY
jgi:hypothetical protein